MRKAEWQEMRLSYEIKWQKKYQFGQPFRKNWNFQQSELADNYGDSHMKESTDRNYKYLNFKETFSVI